MSLRLDVVGYNQSDIFQRRYVRNDEICLGDFLEVYLLTQSVISTNEYRARIELGTRS